VIAVFENILVGLDGSPSSQRALENAIDLARTANGTLTLMTVAPPASSYVTLAGVSPETMNAELDKWASDILDQAAEHVPAVVRCRRVQSHGSAGEEILKELRRGSYDLIVLGTRGRGRAQEGLLGSVNGYLHFHAHLPLLTVPDEQRTG
jgi:nucleotide-binding universal stress UspA family protein